MTKSEESERCIEKVADTGGWRFYRCQNRAKYGEYCGVHSPEKKAERAAKRPAPQWERDADRRQMYRESHQALAEFDLTPDGLRELISSGQEYIRLLVEEPHSIDRKQKALDRFHAALPVRREERDDG